MNSISDETNHKVLTTEPPFSLLQNLKVRALAAQEYQQAGELLDREHYLGDVPQGRQLLQVVEYNGQWVALLDWGPATWKLADRDEWIGWTAQQKAQRLSLVVLNRRFLVLGKTRMPNLASKSLALAIKALPEQWEQAHGYKPLLVFITMALFAGRDNLAAIQRYGRFLTQAQRGWLGFRRNKDSVFRKVPSYTALRNLLIQCDPHQLADCLNQWLQANLGTLSRALAVDGKWTRDRALSLCLSDHGTGAPVAIGFAKEKTKKTTNKAKKTTNVKANKRWP